MLTGFYVLNGAIRIFHVDLSRQLDLIAVRREVEVTRVKTYTDIL